MTTKNDHGAEASLAADNLAEIISFGPAVVYVAEASGKFGATYVSPNVESQLGHAPDDFTGNAAFWADHIHPEDVARVFADLPVLFENGHYTHDYRFRAKDGSYRWMRDVLNLIRDPAGEPQKIVGFWTDITELKNTEERLRRSENRLAEAQRIAKIGSWNWNIQTNELVWSDEIYRIFGLAPRRFAGSYEAFLERVHPDDRQAVTDAVDRALHHNEPYSIEHRIVLPDGEEKIVHERSGVVFDDDGKPLRMIGTVQDTTERHRTETALRQAQKMEVVGQLTGGVAHDFNNLLAIVIGNLEMAADGLPPGSRAHHFIHTAIDAAERGASLTHHLLAFSRQQVLQPLDTDIGKLIADTQDMIAVGMGERITLETRIEDDLRRCRVDPVQLQNAILNLTLNARDAMPSGGTVTIDARNTVIEAGRAAALDIAAGDYVCLSVRDDGPGIPEDILPHIYDPFFTTKEIGKGSGLGLSMVHGFVRQSEGCVEIETAAGEGATFRLLLPAVVADRQAGADREGQVAGDAHSAGDATILLVEDNASFRDITTTILQSLNFRVIAFGTAEDALATIDDATPIDLLLTDIGLPGDMDGHALAAYALSARPDLKIVLMSAHTDPALFETATDRAASDQAGPDHYISAFLRKPHRKAELAGTLRQVLGLEAHPQS